MNDLISRQAAIDALRRAEALTRAFGYHNVIETIRELPSAQPEPHYDEWCHDCKEYDHERHCCPRWNRVIRATLKDAHPERKTGRWEKVQSADCGIDFRCSACRRYRFHNGEMRKKYKYCPNCGAKMEVEHD